MKVLITVGPTAVPIDSVRVITNLSSGKLGKLLFEELKNRGARVDVWLSEFVCWQGMKRVDRFLFYDDLRTMIEGCKESYDWILHCAAVSDFGVIPFAAKLSSNKDITLSLIRLEKLWPKLLDKTSHLVLFKLEDTLSKSKIEARQLLNEDSRVKIVIANAGLRNNYQSAIITRGGEYGPFYSREALAKELVSRVIEWED